MNEEKARVMAKRVFQLIKYSHEVQRFRDIISSDDRFLHQQKYIERIMEYLKEEIGVQATHEQLNILQLGVGERVGGIITAGEFEEKLVLPFHLGGAAFKERDAYMISRHLEKLIAQGAYKVQANELAGAHS